MAARRSARRPRGVAATLALALAVASAACSGKIGARGEPAGGSNSTGAGGSGGGGGGGSQTFVPVASSLRRLTVPQYRNSLRDLLGAGVTLPPELEPDIVISGFASVGAAQVSVSAPATEQFEAAALAAAHQALSNTATRGALVGCTPAGATDAACTGSFLTRFGRKAWRRPLSAAELARWAAVASNAQTVLNDFWGGLEYAVAGLLQSPHFLYREELGAGPPVGANVAFDDWELASRLSFLFWNTTPDDELLDAAAAHRLTDPAGLQGQAQRLLASDRARPALQTFFTELYHLGDLDTLPQLPSAYPKLTATLGASMREQTLRTLEDLVFTRDADYRELLDGTSTFLNAELAGLYGVTAPAAGTWAKVTLPASAQRPGLLGQGAFLALNAHAGSTSPTLRGKFIREVLLCQAIPPPPPDVNAVIPPDPGGGTQTMRQKLEVHRQVEYCRTCHEAMDLLGLALENFDGIGAYRTMDAGQAIDASGALDGVAFDGPAGLAAALRGHADMPVCVARSLYRYATGHVENSGEEPAIRALAAGFQSDGYRLRAMLTGMVRSPAFLTTAAPR